MVTRESLKKKVKKQDSLDEKPITVVSKKGIAKNGKKIKNQTRR